jgi:hypothetical protein
MQFLKALELFATISMPKATSIPFTLNAALGLKISIKKEWLDIIIPS